MRWALPLQAKLFQLSSPLFPLLCYGKHSCLQLWDGKKTCKGCIEERCIVNFLRERSGNDFPANIIVSFFQELEKTRKEKKLHRKKSVYPTLIMVMDHKRLPALS